MEPDLIRELRGDVERIKAALTKDLPFCSSLIRRSRIMAVKFDGLAGVDREGVIWINPEGWKELDFREKSFILAHEALHAANFHPQRVKEDPRAWNLACDLVVNTLLSELMVPPPRLVPPPPASLPWGWERMSAEELYEYLREKWDEKLWMECQTCLLGPDLLPTSGEEGPGLPSAREEGELVQEGDKELYEGSRDERRRKWREALAKAYMAQKLAGRVPAGMERWIEGILKPKLSVRALLRVHLREGIGRTVVGTWVRQSRKNPDMPWIKRFTTPNLWALVDTSGSISSKELGLFIGAIYEFASLTSVRVICWDGQAYETIKCRGRQDLLEKLRRAMKGGGGTVIAPALERLLREMRPWDVVVILSDGEIYDWDQPATRTLLTRCAQKAAKAIFLTTFKMREHPGWISLQLR